MKCKNCNNLYNLTDLNGVIIGRWCPKINDSPDIEIDRECDKYEGMSNADRIRNMSDEKLADYLLEIARTKGENMYICNHDGYNGTCLKEETCEECTLEWLQKEVE